jgi:hypothetical protein
MVCYPGDHDLQYFTKPSCSNLLLYMLYYVETPATLTTALTVAFAQGDSLYVTP